MRYFEIMNETVARRWITLTEMRFDDLGEGYWITHTGAHLGVDAEHLDIAARYFGAIEAPDYQDELKYGTQMGDFVERVIVAIDAHGWIRVITTDDEFGVEVRNWPAVTEAAASTLLRDAHKSPAVTFFLDDVPQTLTKREFLVASPTRPRAANAWSNRMCSRKMIRRTFRSTKTC
jgi:hypothetical protein